ncbi:hypothetical protein ENBRE01_3443 [Enteropsectra breve]|nr:hypothetical protein ENBRE01_3443 [Enteropsectra breve]
MNSIAIAHYKVQQVAYNTETFIVFLEELFAFFESQSIRNATIVMDNVSFHGT